MINTTWIIAGAAVIILVMIIAMILIQTNVNRNMQESIRTLGEMISENQLNASRLQDARLSEQNERISELNHRVHTAMNQASEGLGQMNSISTGLDDLKRLMSNVKSRGIMGELQLGKILDDILSPMQYEENVAVKGDSERVEYAVKFPGEDGNFVYLPIDSKFPGDAYLRLIDAYEIGNRDEIRAASDNLRRAIIKAASDIKKKYISPPLTTEFGIMFLPFEGLYAEVLRLNVIETLQRDYRVSIAGPTTMAAMLNSFQMGFRSLALQQQSGEVWDTLEKAKTEFEKFNDVLIKTQSRIELVQGDLETLVGVRTRGIQKALNKVSEIDGKDSNSL